MISAIRTDSSEVVSTSVPMSILLMIRHSHAKTISAMMASRTLMMVSLFMISTPFYSSYQHTRFFRNCKLGVGFIRRG